MKLKPHLGSLILFFISVSMAIVPKGNSKLKDAELPYEVRDALFRYGSFPESFKAKDQAQTTIESMIKRLSLKGDPPIRVVYINGPEANAYMLRTDSDCCTLVIYRGLFDHIQSQDDLAAVIAHELSHTKKADLGLKRYVGLQREEIIDAELGALDRLLKGGYNPRVMRRFRLKIANVISHFDSSLKSAMASHPPDAFYITATDQWLLRNETKLPIDQVEPLPSEIASLKTTVASKPRKPADRTRTAVVVEPPTPAMPEVVPINRTYKIREIIDSYLKHPDFQKLSPRERFEKLHDIYDYSDYPSVFRDLETYYDPSITGLADRAELIVSRSDLLSPYDGLRKYLKQSRFSVERPPSEADTRKYFEVLIEIAREAPPLDLMNQKSRRNKDLTLREDILNRIELSSGFGFNETLRYLNRANPITSDWSLDRLDNEWLNLNKLQYENAVAIFIEKEKNPKALLKAFRIVRRMERWSSLMKREDSPLIKALAMRTSDIIEAAVRENDIAALLPHKWPLPKSRQAGNSPQPYPEWLKNPIRALIENSKVPLGLRFAVASVHDTGATEFVKKHVATLDELVEAATYVDGVVKSSREAERRLSDSRSGGPDYFSDPLSEKLDEPVSKLVVPFLEGHPNADVNPQAVKHLMKNDSFWPKGKPEGNFLKRLGVIKNEQSYDSLDSSFGGDNQTVSEKIKSVEYVEAGEALKLEAERQGLVLSKDTSTKLEGGLLGPAYERASEGVAEIHQLLLDRMMQNQRFREDFRLQHETLQEMAARAPTDVTDQWAERLYLSENFQCESCLQEILNRRGIWDLQTRSKVFDRLLSFQAHRSRLPTGCARLVCIWQEIQKINQIFPEQSLERSSALENLANAIHANQRETRIIESSKMYGGEGSTLESLAFRAFAGIFQHIRSGHRSGKSLDSEGRQLAFIRYLIGQDASIHPDILSTGSLRRIDAQHFHFLKRQFQSMPPEFKAIVINPFVCEPDGLLKDPKSRAELIDLVTRSMGEYRESAKMTLEALLYGLRKTGEHQESLLLSFFVGQSGATNQESPGFRFKSILQRMGNFGVSFGQKLYQRGLLPEEFNIHLEDLTDEARKPTRHKLFEMISRALENPEVDEILQIEQKLGDASSKVVLKVRYKDGRKGSLDSAALKVVDETFARQNELDSEKIKHMLEYLESQGRPEYRKFRPAIRAVQRGLEGQRDPRLESRHTAKLQELYETPTTGPRFRVIRNRPELGSSALHVNDEVASGISLKEFSRTASNDLKEEIFGALFDKDASILFGDPKPGEDFIEFEVDRHKGNYKVDVSTPQTEIQVFDYPLLRRISVSDRNSVLRMMGLSVGALENRLARKPIIRDLTKLIVTELATEPAPALQAELEKRLRNFYKEAKHSDGGHLIYNVLGEAEILGVIPKTNIEDFLTAIGNLEYYSKFKKVPHGQSAMRLRIGPEIEKRLQGYKPSMSPVHFCLHGMKRFLQRLLKK